MVQVSKTFRIFVSSTFTDMKAERNALQKEVFPKLRELCVQHRCRFQAIDLRWGVRDEAALDQQSIKICMEEIDRCKKTTPRPNFIVILGNRYGWRPLPYEILAENFKEILHHLPADQEKRQQQKILLEKWYRRDDNAIPLVYCLQPRKKNFKKDKNWNPVENELRSILLDAIKEMNLEEKERIKFVASITEQEILHGALSVVDETRHAVCLFRSIKPPLKPSMKNFVDLDDYNNIDQDAEESLNKLKEKLRKKFPDRTYNYKVEWTGEDITTNHIDDFCNDVYNSLSKVILEEITQMKEQEELEKEKEDHENFARKRRKNFIGRGNILHKINDYIIGDNNQPLVVFGKSGSGKTSLISRAILQIQENFPDSEIIYRFIGVTPDSSNGRALLESLYTQISRIQREDETTIPTDYKQLAMDFQKKLNTTTGDKLLILFLDALDQLSNVDNARNLQWLPASLSDRFRMVVSTTPDDCYEMLKLKLPIKNFIEIKPLSRQEGEKILNSWLKDANRTLQPLQKKEVLNKFALNGLPLFLKLAFEEAHRWKSYMNVKDTKLSPNIAGIIRNLFSWLSLGSNHGKLMVSHSLGYLTTSRNGLTEDELIDLLSRDEKVLKNFKKRAHHKLPEEKLPVIVWSRLYFDLEPYLTERSADGTTLLNFYHRQLSEAVEREFLTRRVRNRRHNALARYFAFQDLHIESDNNSFVNLRKISELPYHLKHYLKFKSKTEELNVVRGGTNCLIEISTNFKEDFSLHADEIKPIGTWLSKLKEYEYLIRLTDASLDQLEKQGNWPTMRSILGSASRAARIYNLKINKIRYQFALSCALYHTTLYSDAIELGKEALILAQELDEKMLQADINWHLGYVWRFKGDRDQAIKYVRKAEEINIELNNPVNRARCMYTRAILEHGMGNLVKARDLYDSILKITKDDKIRDEMGEKICDLLRVRGDLGFQQDDLNLARESWELMKEYAEEMYGDLPLKRAVSRLTLIDLIEGKISLKQIKYTWEEELDELLLRQERASALTCYGELAELCIREGSLDEAKMLCEQAELIMKEIDNLHTRSGIAYVRGIRAITEGDIELAKDYFEKSEELFGKWTSPYRYWVSKTLERLENWIIGG